jgi:ABC-2 type transport system ATP-binding protein
MVGIRMDNPITLKNVFKYYEDYPALNDISLNIKKGEICSYLGPNGSGKTTTIKIILGLMKPSSGTVKLLGEDPYLDSVKTLKVRSHIGAMLDYDGLYLNLTGLENTTYWAELHGLSKDKAKYNAIKAIKKVKLLEWAHMTVNKYSHGMKKRLAFARALVNDPDILVLDEPTSGVDPESRIIIREVMNNLVKEGKSIFFSSHDLEEIQKLSPRLALLNNGKLIFRGGLEEFRHQFAQSEKFIQMNNLKEAKIFGRNLEKLGLKIKINGPIISYIQNNGKNLILNNKNIISVWSSQSNLENAYLNAVKLEAEENHEHQV